MGTNGRSQTANDLLSEAHKQLRERAYRNSKHPRLKRFAEEVNYVKVIALVAVSMVGLGVAGHRLLGDVATRQDVDSAMAPAVAEIELVSDKVSDHGSRIIVLERMIEKIDERFDRYDNRAFLQSQQLYEIARKIGARRVPGINPDAGVR